MADSTNPSAGSGLSVISPSRLPPLPHMQAEASEQMETPESSRPDGGGGSVSGVCPHSLSVHGASRQNKRRVYLENNNYK
ncbi:hypothetical protein AAFF_G00057210 [Aldrovandia affinis]|uniref:Uncharacterized protein n=1 Tax=Aldrovandia affinis TaxID=143900 RepID=A0AAD7WE63_9TELE|nr:hypothetical protein AAFF_G00057210 [Aldrovandia affinis]